MTTSSRLRAAGLALAALAAAGCTGQVGVGGGGPGAGTGAAGTTGGPGIGTGVAGGAGGLTGAAGGAATCTADASLAPARIWRLTDAQYVNVVAQVFGVRVPSEVTAADTQPADFTNFSEAPELTVQSSIVTAYQKAAHAAATAAVAANLSIFLPCGKAPTDACVEAFIRNRVARAFGRLVTDAETQDLLAMYHTGLAESVGAGARLIIEATLQAPSFLYRTELGPQVAGGPAAKTTLTPFELATAVSFALLDSVPDDELWGHAVDGSLATPAVLAKQVDRLLAAPAAQANLGKQAGYWLGVEKLQSIVPKNTTIFPAWTPSVQQDLYASARLFVRDLMGTGTMDDLLSSRRMYLNANLAKVYGIPGVTSTTLEAVDVQTPGRDSGIFTQPAILAAWSHPDRGDAVHRGLFIYNAFVCGPSIPPPPANAQTVAATFPADASQRELAMLRATNAAGCGACHGLFDPLGLSTENYDPIGRYITTDDKGQPVDASATIKNLGPDLDGPITGLPDVVTKLKNGRRAADCASRNLAAVVLGRSVATDSSCAFGAVKDHFAMTGSFADYFRAMLTSPAFATRDVAP
jgi:Protein of unknown function (DUF1592)/Protein of unknown function (DUF1588)/Protein of unknown function (DUF1595)/Protein of unknown function (DUF1587)